MSDAFGSEWSTFVGGVPDLDPLFGEISGQRSVQENCARRLMTPNGSLDDDKNFGFDIRTYSSARMTALKKARLKAGIETELRKEQRVLAASVISITITPSSNSMHIVISVTGANGPFPLVLAVDAVSVKILEAP